MTRVAVVGGGIAGLCAAYELRKRGLDCVLIEAEPRLGGKIVTERLGGFLIEGGPDSFVSYKPAGVELCAELGLAGEIIGTEAANKATFILRGGRLEPLPEGASSLAPTRLWPFLATGLLSWKGKLRAGLDLVLPAASGQDDESLGGFMVRRFGLEFYERFAEPLLSGVYAGDAQQLSLRSTFPRLAELERRHGSLIRGMRRQPAAKPGRSLFVTLKGGFQTLVEALRSRLDGVELIQGDGVKALSCAGSGWRLELGSGRAVEADGVILALPAYAGALLLREAAPRASAELAKIPYAASATVAFGFERYAGPLKGYGFLVPAVEGRSLLACTWVSSKYPGRVPGGGALLRAYFGSRGGWQGLSDEALAREALAELRAVMGFTEEPEHRRVFRWERAMPQYQVGHPALLERLHAALSGLNGLYLAGSAYRGVGLPDCIESGRRAAAAAVVAAPAGVF